MHSAGADDIGGLSEDVAVPRVMAIVAISFCKMAPVLLGK